jgi:hypothetical protein
MTPKKKVFIILLAVCLLINSAVETHHMMSNRIGRAEMAMAWGLIIFWIAIGGGLMYRYRDAIRDRVLKIPVDWRLKFFFFVLLLALLEEVVTTTMTNLAPLLGVKVGEAYITASTNYFDVVLFHSVFAALVPGFLAWTILVSFIDFTAFEAFLLYGFMGLLGEAVFGGVKQMAAFAFWIFVYGLMIYLPAYSLPQRAVSPVKWWHYPVAIVFPWILVVPWVLLVMKLLHGHPSVHFPPIRLG